MVAEVRTLHEHMEDITSVRDFPLFEGDFFPGRVKDLIDAKRAPKTRGSANSNSAKRKSIEITDAVRREVKSHRQKFLVATLNASGPTEPPTKASSKAKASAASAARSDGASDLLDSRSRFLELCCSRHWQFDDLPRAQWSTLMMLATLRGAF